MMFYIRYQPLKKSRLTRKFGNRVLMQSLLLNFQNSYFAHRLNSNGVTTVKRVRRSYYAASKLYLGLPNDVDLFSFMASMALVITR